MLLPIFASIIAVAFPITSGVLPLPLAIGSPVLLAGLGF
jgi:hypothetical protein